MSNDNLDGLDAMLKNSAPDAYVADDTDVERKTGATQSADLDIAKAARYAASAARSTLCTVRDSLYQAGRHDTFELVIASVAVGIGSALQSADATIDHCYVERLVRAELAELIS